MLGAALALWVISGSFYCGFLGFLSLWMLLGVAQAFRKRSIRAAFWSLVGWWLISLASAKPLLSKARCPTTNLESRIIKRCVGV